MFHSHAAPKAKTKRKSIVNSQMSKTSITGRKLGYKLAERVRNTELITQTEELHHVGKRHQNWVLIQ